jgi:hypothetical protein
MVWTSRCRALESGDVGEGEEVREGAFGRVLQVEVEGVARQAYGGSDCTKGIFGRVLKFRGHRTSHRIQVVKSSKARRDKIVDVGDGTEGSNRPQDMYARWGVVPFVSVVISVQRVVEFERRGHCAPQSANR